MDGEAWVSPTRLALALSGGPSGEVQQEVAEGYVIVETNYRVKTCSSPAAHLLSHCPRRAMHVEQLQYCSIWHCSFFQVAVEHESMLARLW